jgi:DNA-binding response OmpR family regulator
MSGFSVEKLISDALNGGALGILHKPFAPGELLRALEAARPRGLVLVADDDSKRLETLSELLLKNRYRVEIACTGEEARQKLLVRGTYCLILDLQLPLLSALQVYLGLDGTVPSVPTILLVSEFAEETKLARSVLATRVLVKPFEPTVLLEAVAVLVESRRVAAA